MPAYRRLDQKTVDEITQLLAQNAAAIQKRQVLLKLGCGTPNSLPRWEKRARRVLQVLNGTVVTNGEIPSKTVSDGFRSK